VKVAIEAKKRKLSLETTARDVRDECFIDAAQRHRTRFVFLAHHLEDNAETILGNLFRGAGLRGFAGMRASSAGPGKLIKLRPLLEVRRAELEDYLRAHNLAYRDDSSNASSDHRRNRLRHEVLPLLSDVFHRDVAQLVARLGRLAERDDALLTIQAKKAVEECGLVLESGALKISQELLELHPSLQSRILHHWLRETQSVPHVGHREVEAALAMLGEPGSIMNLPGDAQLRHVRGALSIRKLRPKRPR
jgi:tRNA(Ile)-lysidine synthase